MILKKNNIKKKKLNAQRRPKCVVFSTDAEMVPQSRQAISHVYSYFFKNQNIVTASISVLNFLSTPNF